MIDLYFFILTNKRANQILFLLRQIGVKEEVDLSIFDLALTHKSYSNEFKKRKNTVSSNQRLEFLGDAVLGLVIVQYLYLQYPNDDEGTLTKMESALVKCETLAEVAKEINLGSYLLLGKGEQANGGAQRISNLADALESLLGALFLTLSFDKTNAIVLKLWQNHLNKINSYQDYKSLLQEWLVQKQQVRPEYKVLYEEGPDHQKTFTVGLFVGLELKQQAKGKNRKKAEQQAAFEYLKKMGVVN